MNKVNPTVARVVKKGLWKDIHHWFDVCDATGPIRIEHASKKNTLKSALQRTRTDYGNYYIGAFLREVKRFPSRNTLVVLRWEPYVNTKRLAVIPIEIDNKLDEQRRRGISITEHAIEQMATRLDTLDRNQIIAELAAAAMPACLLVMNFVAAPKDGEYFAVKTPHGVGVLAIDHLQDLDIVGYLVTWISDEEARSPKFTEIDWIKIPRKNYTDTAVITVDIPKGSRMYLPHALTKAWALTVIEKRL